MLRGCASSGNPFSDDLDFEMTLTAAPHATGTAAWADALLLSFAQAGYVQAAVSYTHLTLPTNREV